MLEYVREHWLAYLRVRGERMPKFIRDEFERFLQCGDISCGYATVVCTRCGREHDVAFSCKRRGFCFYCLRRRMFEQATFVQDNVIGDTAVRHWVLSLPPPLRNLLGFDSRLASKVLAAFIAAIQRHYLVKAREVLADQLAEVLGAGVVTAIHRVSSMLRACLHFHSAVTAGVFIRVDGVVSFLDLPAPTPAEICAVAWDTCKRVVRMFRREGAWVDLPPRAGDPEHVLGGVLDMRSRKRKVRFNASAARHHVAPPAMTGVGTFDVWIGEHVQRGDAPKLRRLLRYFLAPPILDDQLVRHPDGRITFALKRSRRDGTGTRTCGPIEFLNALRMSIPEPHYRLLRLHGVYARRAKYRDEVVPKVVVPEPVEPEDDAQQSDDRRAWAELLHRAYEVDVTRCRCGGRLLLIVLESDRLTYRREQGRGPPQARNLPPAA